MDCPWIKPKLPGLTPKAPHNWAPLPTFSALPLTTLPHALHSNQTKTL